MKKRGEGVIDSKSLDSMVEETYRVLVLPDVHLGEQQPKPYKILKKYINQNTFDEIVLLGDFMDCASLSHWNENKRRLIEGKRYNKEIELANKELDDLQRHAYKITFIEGNHENWVEQYLDKHPEMEGMLEIPEKLNLEERDIDWIPMNELYKIGKLYFTHGMFTNKYHANNHLLRLGCNIMYGHTHNSQTFMNNQKMQDPHMAYGLGCLCDDNPSYMKGRPANWINQFSIVEFDKGGNFNVNTINIIKNRFILDGKVYK